MINKQVRCTNQKFVVTVFIHVHLKFVDGSPYIAVKFGSYGRDDNHTEIKNNARTLLVNAIGLARLDWYCTILNYAKGKVVSVLLVSG